MGCTKLKYQNFSFLEIVHPEKRVSEEKKRINYYPFGLKHKGYNNVFSPNGNSTAQKFGFGGKELQDDNINGSQLNWHDFGARNYDASLGRWMNLDPLAAHYLSESPYHYVLNNPLRFTDPDGRKIVDEKGNEVKVNYTVGDNGVRTASFEFAEGTSRRTMRRFNKNGGKVINSTINSKKGLGLVNSAIASKDNISINLSSESTSNSLGKTNVTLISGSGDDVDGSTDVKNIEITIYTGTIDNLTEMPDIKKLDNIVKKRTQNIKNNWKKNKSTRSQKIAGVAGHELYHAAIERGVRVTTTQHQKAYDAEEVILKEFGVKNKKKNKK